MGSNDTCGAGVFKKIPMTLQVKCECGIGFVHHLKRTGVTHISLTIFWMIGKYERKSGTKPIDDWLLVRRGSWPQLGRLESGQGMET